jgi:regulator of protease activity HflC (stomatin/prohibitin superfamily)
MALTHGKMPLKSWSPRAPRVHIPSPRPRPVQDGLDPVRGGKRRDPPPWALMLMRRRGLRRLATFVAALLCLALIVAVSGVRVARGSAGTVGVVRNGGPLDARTIRQIIMPGQSLTYTGLFSQSPHLYPASHVTLKYTVTSSRTARPQPAVDTIVLPTKDGVQVGIDAAVFFRFIGDSDIATLERFDMSVGTRRFGTTNGRRLYPWQGDDGFGAMLDSLFRPVLENDLRKEVGGLPCASLVSSCALVRSGVLKQAVAPSENIAGIEGRINDSLESDLEQALGHRFFLDIRFRVGRVTLPTNVQQAVDQAQAEFAAVNSAQAELRQARYLARRNRLLGDTYNRSPGLAAIEALKAIPQGSTVIMSPGGRAPTILAGAGGAGGGGTAGGRGTAGGAGGPGSAGDAAGDSSDSGAGGG